MVRGWQDVTCQRAEGSPCSGDASRAAAHLEPSLPQWRTLLWTDTCAAPLLGGRACRRQGQVAVRRLRLTGPLRRSALAGPGRSGPGPGRFAPPPRGPAGPAPRPLPPLAAPPEAATGTADRSRGRARSANCPPARAGGPPRLRPAAWRVP